MRLFNLLLVLSGGLVGRACPFDHEDTVAAPSSSLRHGRTLASPSSSRDDKRELQVPVVHENRDSLDWTYIPNYDYKCEEVGCCGLPDDVNPARQPCGSELWHFLNANTSKRCIADGISRNQQSPIRIITEGPDKMTLHPIIHKVGKGNDTQAIPIFAKNKCRGDITFAKNTWEVEFKDDCLLSVQLFGRKWHLVNFHFHNAEHTINGIYLPLEVHMVHRALAGTDAPDLNDHKTKKVSAVELTNDFLVLAVFLVPGQESSYFSALEATPGADDRTMETRTVDPYDIIPKSRKYWHYEGSLTTPPCQVADGAKVQDSVQLSMNQLGFFGSYLADIRKSYNGEVNRPLQPVNHHTKVYEYTPESLHHHLNEDGHASTATDFKATKAKHA